MDKAIATKKFYEIVTSKCNELKLTTRDFCEQIGWNERSFSAMKCNNHPPNFLQAFEAFNFLGIAFNQFIDTSCPSFHQYVLTPEEEKLILLLRRGKRNDVRNDAIFLTKALLLKRDPSSVSINSDLLPNTLSNEENVIEPTEDVLSAHIVQSLEAEIPNYQEDLMRNSSESRLQDSLIESEEIEPEVAHNSDVNEETDHFERTSPEAIEENSLMEENDSVTPSDESNSSENDVSNLENIGACSVENSFTRGIEGRAGSKEKSIVTANYEINYNPEESAGLLFGIEEITSTSE